MNQINIPQEMIKKYLLNRNNDLINCTQALNENNFDFLTKIGHQIKGNASSFGFKELGDIAIELEKHSLLKNTIQIKIILEIFRTYLISVSII